MSVCCARLSAEMFHIERVRRVTAAAGRLNVAEVAKGSGAEWKQMTDEQRQPYKDMAELKRQEMEAERNRVGKMEKDSMKESVREQDRDEGQQGSGHRRDSKKVKQEPAGKQRQQEDDRQLQAAAAESAEPAAGRTRSGGGDGDDGELSPALSLRRASVITDGGAASPRRPASAAQLFINEHVKALQHQARRGGGKAASKRDLSKVSSRQGSCGLLPLRPSSDSRLSLRCSLQRRPGTR